MAILSLVVTTVFGAMDRGVQVADYFDRREQAYQARLDALSVRLHEMADRVEAVELPNARPADSVSPPRSIRL